jgi:hypothetical protein
MGYSKMNNQLIDDTVIAYADNYMTELLTLPSGLKLIYKNCQYVITDDYNTDYLEIMDTNTGYFTSDGVFNLSNEDTIYIKNYIKENLQ